MTDAHHAHSTVAAPPIPRIADAPLPAGTAAHALWVRATAPARHAARVAATVHAARAVADAILADAGIALAAAPDSRPDLALARRDLLAAVALIADLLGTGGPLGLGGANGASARAPGFDHLGKGRWQATDGGAYRAAAGQAVGVLLGATPETWGTLQVRLGGVFDGGVGAWVHPDDAPVHLPPAARWIALAGRALLAAHGVPHDADADGWQYLAPLDAGDARAFGAWYDACCACCPPAPATPDPDPAW